MLQFRRGALGLVVVVAALACRSTLQPRPPRYLFTERAILVGEGIELCLAVDPGDPQGVWWWMPGTTGCTTRSSGPGLVHADQATVSRDTAARRSTVSFRLGTHSARRAFIDVRLVVQDGRMRAVESGTQVMLRPRADLNVPERPISVWPESGASAQVGE
jgi:hypothetical protein